MNTNGHNSTNGSGSASNVNNNGNNNNTGESSDSFNPVKVYAWFASIPSLCKSIWLMAVAQHQFYLDKKQNRDNISQFKSLNDLANDLNKQFSQSMNGSLNNHNNSSKDSLNDKSTNGKHLNGGVTRKALSMNNMSSLVSSNTPNETKKCKLSLIF